MAHSKSLKALLDMIFWVPKTSLLAYEKYGDENDRDYGYRQLDSNPVAPFLQGGGNVYLEKIFSVSDMKEFDEKIIKAVESHGFTALEAQKLLKDEYVNRQRYVVSFAPKNRSEEALLALRNLLEHDIRFSELKNYVDLNNLTRLDFGEMNNGITFQIEQALKVLGREVAGRFSYWNNWMVDQQGVDANMGSRVETVIATSNDKLSVTVDGRYILTTLCDDALFFMVTDEDFSTILEPSAYAVSLDHYSSLRPIIKYLNACAVVTQAELDAGGKPEFIELHVEFDREATLEWLKEARPEVMRDIEQNYQSESKKPRC